MISSFFNAAASRLAMHRFGGALMVCALAAAAFPSLILWRQGPPGQALLALLGSTAAILVMLYLLRPLSGAARALQACLTEVSEDAAAGSARGIRGLAAQAAELAVQLHGFRQRLGHRNPTTGLPTREPFLAELSRDAEAGGAAVVLGVVRFTDYDRLAAFDQAAADQALAVFAARLRESMPRSRPVAQVDRDCFAAWFRGAERGKAAGELQALIYVLEQEMPVGEARMTPQIAVGASVFPDDSRVPSELLTRAMAALEGARASRVAFFSAEDSAAAKEQFSLEQDLRGAMGRGEFMLQFQPLVDLEERCAVGAEALLRWRHPTLGLVGPDRFIPILERSRMMGEVGLWVLNTACRQLRSWRDQGLGDLKMAVNLSAAQCSDPRLCEMVVRTLERHGLPPSSLELELTETAALEDADHIRRLFTDLRALGVSVAIDDFGAGYSSLSYLKNLPFSKLKIDREFVKDVTLKRDSRAICSALMALSQGLGIPVLAEGVETPEQVAALREMGCRLFQGYIFARPLDGSDFAATVRDPAWLSGAAKRGQSKTILRKLA